MILKKKRVANPAITKAAGRVIFDRARRAKRTGPTNMDEMFRMLRDVLPRLASGPIMQSTRSGKWNQREGCFSLVVLAGPGSRGASTLRCFMSHLLDCVAPELERMFVEEGVCQG